MMCVSEKQVVPEKPFGNFDSGYVFFPNIIKYRSDRVEGVARQGRKIVLNCHQYCDAKKIIVLLGLNFFCYIIPGEAVENLPVSHWVVSDSLWPYVL